MVSLTHQGHIRCPCLLLNDMVSVAVGPSGQVSLNLLSQCYVSIWALAYKNIRGRGEMPPSMTGSRSGVTPIRTSRDSPL